MSNNTRTRVHVHLDFGRSEQRWRERFDRGTAWEPTPYSYGYARQYVDLSFSEDRREHFIVRLIRESVRRIFGFDLIHAYRNRRTIFSADVVWTHTEENWLAIAFLSWFMKAPTPILIAQSVWLWDRWESISSIRRAFYRLLMKVPDLHTTLSPWNCTIAQAVGLESNVVFVPFGIEPITDRPFPSDRRDQQQLVLVVGNDRDRDWSLLVKVAKSLPAAHFLVASRAFGKWSRRQTIPANLTNFQARDRDELLDAYAASSVVFIPLHHNSHASGVTVGLEALWAGRRVVVADTGGIREYFEQRHASFYDVGNATSAIDALASALNDQGAFELTPCMVRASVANAGLTGRDYAMRHVALTRFLLDEMGPSELLSVSSFAPTDL